MAEADLDLWGDGIDVDNLPPVTILNSQAAILERRTNGLIAGEVSSETSGEVNFLYFDVVSLVARHRRRLLVCRYLGDDVYPTWVSSFALKQPPKPKSLLGTGLAGPMLRSSEPSFPDELNLGPELHDCTEPAWDQHSFNDVIAKVFQSPPVRAKINSMLALANAAAHKSESSK